MDVKEFVRLLNRIVELPEGDMEAIHRLRGEFSIDLYERSIIGEISTLAYSAKRLKRFFANDGLPLSSDFRAALEKGESLYMPIVHILGNIARNENEEALNKFVPPEVRAAKVKQSARFILEQLGVIPSPRQASVVELSNPEALPELLAMKEGFVRTSVFYLPQWENIGLDGYYDLGGSREIKDKDTGIWDRSWLYVKIVPRETRSPMEVIKDFLDEERQKLSQTE